MIRNSISLQLRRTATPAQDFSCKAKSGAQARPTDVLEISASDAAQLNLETGERVRVYSRYGEAILPVRISSALKNGELFATFHTAEVFLNCLTSSHRDRYVKTPEYKITAVQIEKYRDV